MENIHKYGVQGERGGDVGLSGNVSLDRWRDGTCAMSVPAKYTRSCECMVSRLFLQGEEDWTCREVNREALLRWVMGLELWRFLCGCYRSKGVLCVGHMMHACKGRSREEIESCDICMETFLICEILADDQVKRLKA